MFWIMIFLSCFEQFNVDYYYCLEVLNKWRSDKSFDDSKLLGEVGNFGNGHS